MRTDEIEEVESYYFGVWGQPGHYTYNRHRQGIHPGATPGEVPSFLTAAHMDQRYCRSYGGKFKGDEPEGVAFLQVIEINERSFEGQKWTILAFSDRTGDPRPGSNSAFVAKGVFTFRDMCNIARAHYPTLWERMIARFEIRDVQAVR